MPIMSNLWTNTSRHVCTDMCESIRAFMKLCKGPEQTVADYLSSFDSMYNRACTKGLTVLPQAYLMFLVLENAHLEDQDSAWS